MRVHLFRSSPLVSVPASAVASVVPVELLGLRGDQPDSMQATQRPVRFSYKSWDVSADLKVPGARDFFTKLHVWELTQFNKVGYC